MEAHRARGEQFGQRGDLSGACEPIPQVRQEAHAELLGGRGQCLVRMTGESIKTNLPP